MANTKNLARDERKVAKRKARKELKAAELTLTRKDRTAIRKSEDPLGKKQYLLQKAAKAAEA